MGLNNWWSSGCHSRVTFTQRQPHDLFQPERWRDKRANAAIDAPFLYHSHSPDFFFLNLTLHSNKPWMESSHTLLLVLLQARSQWRKHDITKREKKITPHQWVFKSSAFRAGKFAVKLSKHFSSINQCLNYAFQLATIALSVFSVLWASTESPCVRCTVNSDYLPSKIGTYGDCRFRGNACICSKRADGWWTESVPSTTALQKQYLQIGLTLFFYFCVTKKR